MERPHRRDEPHRAPLGARAFARRADGGDRPDHLQRTSTSSTASRPCGGTRPERSASASARSASVTYGRTASGACSASASRLRCRVIASPRTAGPVSASAAPTRRTFASVASCRGASAAIGSGTPGDAFELLGQGRHRDDVVGREHGGRVIQRLALVGEAERVAARVTREPFAEREPVLTKRGHRERRAGDRLDGGLDGRTRLQRVDGQRRRAGGRGGLERVQTRRAARVHDGARGSERARLRHLAAHGRDHGVGRRDHDDLGPGRGLDGVQDRDAREEAPRAFGRRGAAGDRDDPMPGALPQDRERGPDTSGTHDREIHRPSIPLRGSRRSVRSAAASPRGARPSRVRRRASRRSPRPWRGTGDRPHRRSHRSSGPQA